MHDQCSGGVKTCHWGHAWVHATTTTPEVAEPRGPFPVPTLLEGTWLI